MPSLPQTRPSSLARLLPVAAAVALSAGHALAGGTPENVLVIANPASAESMYLANYYKAARNIPESNVLYIRPGATSYAAFAGPGGNIAAVMGQLTNARLGDHIDYIVIADPASFYIDAPGYVSDSCFPVNRFSLTGAYTLAFQKDTILAGGVASALTNQYYSLNTASPLAFDSNVSWLAGGSSGTAQARRYFIGAQLGYTGSLGTALGDIFQMIDRSVGADNTRPAGTFYYMDNRADPIRNIRACGSFSGCNGTFPYFTTAVNALTALGGTGEIVQNVLPTGRSNCLGILTGASDPTIDTETMTILPGAFCDHLTSWAATFDNGAQTKMSAWIRRGASGTAGTVEEPCAYPGKFPHSSLHVNYFQGLSLGEAYLRSLGYAPFQQMFMGDPMTRPFATLPVVTATAPIGSLTLDTAFTPLASTSRPGSSIARLELYVDGRFSAWNQPGQSFTIHPGVMADGYHDIRVIAYDNSAVKNAGRWIGSVTTGARGHTVGLTVGPATGTLSTSFSANVTIGGPGTASEVRLLSGGRVIAAYGAGHPFVPFYGRNLGAGPSSIQAEVLYTDGSTARSAPFPVAIDYAAPAVTPPTPTAYSYTKRVARGASVAVELPGSFPDGTGVSWNIVSPPAGATLTGDNSSPYRVLTTPASACGQDQLTFTVQTASGTSAPGTIRLVYGAGDAVCLADTDDNGQLTILDFNTMLNQFSSGSLRADINGDCALNVLDFNAFLNAFSAGCP
jgi:hypothetical protein